MTETFVTVGIDLALRSAHTAVAKIAGEEAFHRLTSFHTHPEQLAALVNSVERLAGPEACIEFIMEPTSNAWFPVARWLKLRGFEVYMVRPEKVADLRRYLSKHTKSDTIDAKTLASMNRFDGDDLFPVRLQGTQENACWRLSKQRARYAHQVSSIKTRVQDFMALAVPGLPAVLQDPFTRMGRKLLEELLNPHRVVAMGLSGFVESCRQAHRGPLAVGELENIFRAFQDASQLYAAADHCDIDFDALQEEVGRELQMLTICEAFIKELDEKIAALYRQIDPDQILTTIQGVGPTIGAAITARVGNIADFPTLKAFRKYCGFTPRKKQTSNTDRQGLHITKTANSLLKNYLYMAAETARHWDVEFAAFYDQLVYSKKKHHNKALAALANKMVGRIYAVLKRAADSEHKAPVPYQQRDLQGQPISKQEARKLVLELTSQRKTKKEKRSAGTTR
jgi:transposase